MRQVLIALLLCVAVAGADDRSVAQQAAASAGNVLWYRAPAANWNEALPIGNGRLGAMVFGGILDERLQLNEETVWAGQKLDRVNPQAAASLPEIRRLLFAGKPVEAEAIADKTIISIPRRMPPYETLGDRDRAFEILRGSNRQVLEELEVSWGTEQMQRDPRWAVIAAETRSR